MRWVQRYSLEPGAARRAALYEAEPVRHKHARPHPGAGTQPQRGPSERGWTQPQPRGREAEAHARAGRTRVDALRRQDHGPQVNRPQPCGHPRQAEAQTEVRVGQHAELTVRTQAQSQPWRSMGRRGRRGRGARPRRGRGARCGRSRWPGRLHVRLRHRELVAQLLLAERGQPELLQHGLRLERKRLRRVACSRQRGAGSIASAITSTSEGSSCWQSSPATRSTRRPRGRPARSLTTSVATNPGDGLVAFRTPNAFVLPALKQRVLNRGHMLVLPRAHVTRLIDVEPALLQELYALAGRVSMAVREAFGSTGATLFQNDDSPDQVLLHIHIHVVPRRPDDDFKLPDPTSQELTQEERRQQALALGLVLAARESGSKRAPGADREPECKMVSDQITGHADRRTRRRRR